MTILGRSEMAVNRRALCADPGAAWNRSFQV